MNIEASIMAACQGNINYIRGDYAKPITQARIESELHSILKSRFSEHQNTNFVRMVKQLCARNLVKFI